MYAGSGVLTLIRGEARTTLRLMPRPNWFFAFPVEGNFVLELPALPRGFRLFHPDDVHITLAFLGGCGEAKALRALERLDHALAVEPLHPVTISLGPIVPMGRKGRYTALSAELADGQEEVKQWLASLEGVLVEVATGRGRKRDPVPHVTIARPRRRATHEDRRAGLAWASGVDLTGIRSTLDRVALYTWAEVRRERQFRIVQERRLG